jgi:PAS domain S-box-containing protein
MDQTPVRVLLVDDDENAFILLRRLLSKISREKFDVEWASSYNAGLAAIQRQRHDVYLVDYRLGPDSGLDLLSEAISLPASAPIIILTGADDPKVDLEAMRMGAADFLVKDHLDAAMVERSIRYSMQHFATLKALRKSHERFRLLFERSMDAILISDDEGKIIEVNSAACKLLRYSHDRLLDMKMSDLLDTKSSDLAHDLPDHSFAEISLTIPSGERRFAEFSACQFAPNLHLNILRDITERRDLEKEISEISEKEQRRLGQDLHDGLGQSLAGISFLTKVLQQKLAAKKAEEEKDAALIVKLIKQSLLQAREVARGLCPTVLDTNDLQAALEQLSENLKKYFSIASEANCDPAIKIIDNAVAVHLYRIAQEASTNAIKHGKAKKIWISLSRQNRAITLQIRDNGVGFSAKAVKKSKGMGLRVMQHRARMIGALLEVNGKEGRETTVTCTVGNKITLKNSAKKIGAESGTHPKRKSKSLAAAV